MQVQACLLIVLCLNAKAQNRAVPARNVSLPSSSFAGNDFHRRSVFRREQKQGEEIAEIDD